MKTAVFYDLENIGLVNKNGEFSKAMDALKAKIEASDLVGEVVLQKAYISKANTALPNIESALKNHNIELVVVEPLLDAGQKKKNLVDFKMAVDVTATIASRRSIATVAVASGDNDFGFLCEQVKKMRKNLVVVSRYSTMGTSLLKICDDWIDLNEQAITPKFICKAINMRICDDYSNMDFLTAIKNFLNALGSDTFIRRYMEKHGLPTDIFVGLLNTRKITFSNYQSLGFITMSGFLSVLLNGTDFECRKGSVKYSIGKEPLTNVNLISNYLNLPDGYSREKLLKYHDVLAQVDNIDELLTYSKFMSRCGMIQDNKLCSKRTFRSAIRKHIRAVMEKSGIILDDDALAEIDRFI